MSFENYLTSVFHIIENIRETQAESIQQACHSMSNSIASDGWVHLFGAGHAHLPVEEGYPKCGNIVGLHPILELSLSYFTNVLGSGGVPQITFLERVEGYGEAILQAHDLDRHDTMVVFSQSGINSVSIDVALGAKRRGLTTVGITSIEHSRASSSRHSSGYRLFEVVDIVIDNCVPPGDAILEIPGVSDRVGPASSLVFILLINGMIAQTAQNLAIRGCKVVVNPSLNDVGDLQADDKMRLALTEYARRRNKRDSDVDCSDS